MSNYLSECHRIMKKYKHTSVTKFLKQYIYRDTAVSSKTPYHGLYLNKLPCDFFIYPDLVYNYQPDTIIEIGTAGGGSAIWFSDLLHLYGGHVITIDVNKPSSDTLKRFYEKNILFIHGDATTTDLYNQVLDHVSKYRVIVVDDGSHMINDIVNSFNLFSQLVKQDGFYIIEDGMSGLLFKDHPNRQPCIAIQKILDGNKDFKLFTEYDQFMLTAMLRGILRKIN